MRNAAQQKTNIYIGLQYSSLNCDRKTVLETESEARKAQFLSEDLCFLLETEQRASPS